jgi:hypothetical protein
VGDAVSGASAGVDERMKGFMDVWWLFDLFPSNGLMLLLPYLLQKHRAWSRCATRLFVVATPTTDLAKLKRLIQTLIAAGGIVVQVCKLVALIFLSAALNLFSYYLVASLFLV